MVSLPKDPEVCHSCGGWDGHCPDCPVLMSKKPTTTRPRYDPVREALAKQLEYLDPEDPVFLQPCLPRAGGKVTAAEAIEMLRQDAPEIRAFIEDVYGVAVRVVRSATRARKRPEWDDYFMAIARAVARRATCDRKLVGAVIVDAQRRIVATGYNGAPRGLPHCDDAGHELKEIDGRMSCVRTLHAESNALDDAGRRAEGCVLYVTVIPCYDCAKRIVHAGIKRVVYGEYYQSRNTELVLGYLATAGVEVSS